MSELRRYAVQHPVDAAHEIGRLEAENERLSRRLNTLQKACQRIERAHAPAEHLQAIARDALEATSEPKEEPA